MSSLKDQIAKDVQEIKEDNKKHFGTKLPGNDNKEQEQTEQELTYSQMIMGSLASMVWGVQNVKDDPKVKTLLSQKDNIYNLIKSIKVSIDNAVNNGLLTVNVKLTKESITSLKTNLSDPVVQEIRDIPDSLTEVLSDTADTIAKSIVSSLDLDNKFKNLSDRLKGFDAGQNDIYNSLFIIGDELRQSIIGIKPKNIDYNQQLTDINSKLESEKTIFTELKKYSKANATILQYFYDNLPKTITDSANAIINAIGKSKKNKESLKDSTTKILIDLKAADTIKDLVESFNKLESYPFFDNKNLSDTQSVLETLQNLSENKPIWLVVDFKDLSKLQDEINKLKINFYNEDLVDQIKQFKDSLNEDLPIKIFDENIINNIVSKLNEINQLGQIKLFDIDSINKIDELLKSINALKGDKVTDNIISTLTSLIHSINTLDLKELKTDKTKLSKLLNVFNDKGDIKKILDAIEERGKQLTGDKIKILNDAFKIMELSAKLMEGEDKNFNEKFFSNLIKLLGKDGKIKEIIIDLNSVGQNLNEQSFKILNSAFSVITMAAKLMEGHDTKINKKFFSDLNTILTGKEYIKGLINNLSGLHGIIDETVSNDLKVVDNFITTVVNLGNIGFIKLIKSKIAIKAINNFLIKDIKNLIDEIAKFKVIKQDTNESFKALDHLFDSIVKLGDITISDKRKMAKNIIFIEKFLAEDIKNIIENSIPSLKKNQKEGFEVLEKTKGIIDSLIAIADVDQTKMELTADKMEDIKDFICDDVNELLKYISENLGPKKELQKIIEVTDLTKEIFENIEDMNDSIPSVMSLIKSNVKVVLLATEFAFIEESFKTLSKISKILTNKDKQFLSKRFDGTLDSIIEINGVLASINTKQGIKDILALDSELAHMYWCMDFMKEIAESYTKVLKFNEFKKTIQNIKSVIDSIEISKEDYKKLGALTALLNTMYTLGQYASDKTTFDIEKFDEATEAILTGAIPFISEFVKDSELDKNLQNLMSVNDKMLDKFDQIIKLIEKFDKLSKIAVLSKISNIGLKGIVQEAEYIKVIIGKFGDIDNKEIKKAEKSLNLFKKLVIMSAAILLAGALIMKFIKIQDLLAFTGTLAIFLFAVTGVFRLVAKALKPAMEGARGAVLLIAASALIMLAGSLVMNYVDFGNLLLFTASLSIFLFAITGIFRLFSKGFEQALDGAKDAMLIVAASALIMLVGSRLVKPEDFLASLLFAVELGVFLAAIGLAFKLWESFDSKAIMTSAEDVCLIIGVSALALILSGLVTKYVGIADVLLFTLELASLIVGTIIIFMAASKFTPGALESARDIAILIGVSGLVLILAGLLANHIKFGWLALFVLELAVLIGGVLALYAVVSMIPVQKYLQMGWELSLLVAASGLILILAGLVVKYIDLGSLFLFTLILGAFIGGILLIYSIASKGFKHAFKGAKEMAILIAASALILILGSIAVQKWIDIPSLIVFTLLLAGFIFAITYTYGVFGKQIKKSIVPAIALALLTAISGLVLIMGGKYILDHPGLLGAVIEFASILIVYTALMGGVCYLLGKFIAKIVMGIVAMALLMAVTALATSVIGMISSVASQEGFLLNMVKGVVAIAGVIAAIGGIAFAAGALVMGPQALLFFAGVGVIATIAGLALLASQAVKNIADAMIHMKEVEKFDPSIMIDNIKGFIAIAKEMEPIADSFSMIMKASIAIQMMSSALSSVAKTLKDWADLKIPVYKGTEIVGYETITGDMFPKAAENIKAVVTTLGQAIIDVYNEKPEMFDGPLFGLLDTPFIKVTKGLKTMGPMLSSVAEAIKDWAELKIPVYKGKEVVGYETITGEMFPKAADNIKQVVTTLGQAIIDVYNEKPEMFDGPLFGLLDTPFVKVTKALKTMGPMLASIAKGVKDWADLKIPIYKDGSTEIESYLSLSSDDFDKVGENVDSVVTCLISSVASLYDEHNDWFDGTGLFGRGDSPIGKVLGSIGPLGSSLKDIADAVQAWADLKIPIYGQDEKGKAMITGYITMGDDTFVKVTKNIDKVVTSLIRSVASLYEPHKDWFDGTGLFGLGDSPIGKVLGSIGPLGKTLKDIADAVQAWADLKIPVYGVGPNGEAQITSYKTLGSSDFTKATQNINKVVTSLVRSVAALYFDPVAQKEGWFDGGWFLGKSPISKVLTSIEPLGNVLKGIADAITAFADFKIPIYGQGKDGEAIITGYKTLADADIVKAGANIGAIVTVLAKAIGNLYFDPEAKAQGWFDTNHWWESKTPFSKVITAMEPMGNMLAGVAEGIKGFADFKIPVYGKNKKGELVIVDYKTLASADFATAAKNIGLIITTLGNAIGNVVKNNPGIFDKADSPVKKAAESIKITGDTLTGVANVIASYATGKFPLLKYDKDGKLIPGETVTIGLDQIEAMKKRVNAVITALGQSIIDVYNDPNNKGVFDSWQGTHFKQDAPAAIVAGSIKGIADALKTSLDVITKIIELDFNKIAKDMNAKDGLVTSFKDVIRAILAVYGSVSQNGFWVYDFYNRGTWEGKTNIAQWMQQNVGNVTSLSNAIKKSSDDIKKIFESIKGLNESYSSNKTAIDKLLKSDIKENLNNIFELLTTITNSLVLFGIQINKSSNIKEAKQLTNKIESSLKTIFKSIVKINDIYKDKETQAAISSLTGDDKFKNSLEKIINNDLNKLGIINYLISNINICGDAKQISKNTQNNNKILHTVTRGIKEIFKAISKIYKLYDKHKEDIDNIIIKDTSDRFILVAKISDVLTLVNSINRTVVTSSDFNVKEFAKKISNNKIILNDIEDLLDEVLELNELNNKVAIVSFDNVENAVTKFLTCIDNIKKKLHGEDDGTETAGGIINGISAMFTGSEVDNDFVKLIEQARSIFDLTNELLEITNVAKDIDGNTYSILSTGISTIHTSLASIKIENQEDINKFISDLENYIAKINLIYSSVLFTEKVNSLKDGILNVYTVTKEIESNDKFKQHAESLKKYIQTINSVELGKLSMMKGFVDAMNQLSMRLGSLDNLTEAIANKLSAVLYELVNQLTKADASINNAHQLQEKRKKLIDESVSKIENLMSQHMIVEVSQVTQNDSENNNTSYSQGNINNKEVDGNTPSGTEYDKSSSDKRLSSPEETDVQKQKQQNMPNVLTKEEFDNAMRDKWVKAIAKAVKS